jgi:serine protease
VIRAAEPAPTLAPLREIGKTGGRLSAPGSSARVVVKFREGVAFPNLADADELAAKAASEPVVAEVAREALPGGVRATFERAPAELRAEEARLEAATGVDLADLSRYFDVDTASPEAAEALARRLERFDEVELAYVQPEMVPASFGAPQEGTPAAAVSTPDLTHFQYYLGRAPGGFGVDTVREVTGGRGEGVRIVDVQFSWDLSHEDLPFASGREPIVHVEGFDPFPNERKAHGTASIGMLVAADNGFGVTGICPEAEIGLMNPQLTANDLRLAQTIEQASSLLTREGARGHIIQLELQARGVSNELALLPPEWDPAVFDAVQRAVARGCIVVEPAGNGGLKNGKVKGFSLDRSELGGRFNRKKLDSGAIIVGGGFPIDASRTPFSNYGSRVDVQGYGAYVTTLGFGDLYTGGTPSTAYTAAFEGTSSAVPCITGVVALVQGTLRASGLPVLDAKRMRDVLVGTGTPDGSITTEPIGPRPNVALAVSVVTDPSKPFITGITYKKKKDRLIVDGFYFGGAAGPVERRSVIYINGIPVETEYPTGFDVADGSTTRIQATGVSGLLPAKTIVYVSVSAGDEVRSPQRLFIRR